MTTALTRRDRQTLELMLEGLDAHAIAQYFGCSHKTALGHMRSVRNKHGVESTEELKALHLKKVSA